MRKICFSFILLFLFVSYAFAVELSIPGKVIKQAIAEGTKYKNPSARTVRAKIVTGIDISPDSHNLPLLVTIVSPFKPLKGNTAFTADQCRAIAEFKRIEGNGLLSTIDITTLSCIDDKRKIFEFPFGENQKSRIGWLRETNTQRGVFAVKGKKLPEIPPGKDVIIEFERPIDELKEVGDVNPAIWKKFTEGK